MQNGLKTFSQVLKASNFNRNISPCTCIELRKVKFILILFVCIWQAGVQVHLTQID